MNEKFKDKIYIFDLDGTLADSMPVATKVVLSLLDREGIAYSPDIVKTLTPLGFWGIAEYYASTLGVAMLPKEIFAWFIDTLRGEYERNIPLREGALETLRELKKRGVRLCVLTGSPHAFVDPLLKRTGAYDLFERVWSTDDFDCLKSDVRIYEEVAELLGVTPRELLILDDGINVVKTAKKAGAYTVGVYDSYSAGTAEQMQSLADGYIRNFLELL